MPEDNVFQNRGAQRGPQQLPDLGGLLQALLGKVSEAPKRFLKFLLIGLLLIGIFKSFFTVPTDSECVITRFGKQARIVQPGLHFKLPFGMETAYVVPVKRQLKLEFGFSTEGGTNRYQYAEDSQQEDLAKSMITGDRNSALVEWVIQYHIEDPAKYLFHVRKPEETMRDLAESVMREVVGDRTIDEVLTIGRQGIESDALLKLKDLTKVFSLGFTIDQVQLKNVNPPERVQASFSEVNQAQQERESMINVARGEYNKAVPRARGEADREIAQAEGYRLQRINEADGDAARFTSLHTEYSKAPEVTRERLYQEAMAGVLGRTKRKIIMDGNTNNVLPLLPLNQLPALDR